MKKKHMPKLASISEEPEEEDNAAEAEANAAKILDDPNVFYDWVRNAVKLPNIANALKEADIDGVEAISFTHEEWMELGAKSLHASKMTAYMNELCLHSI